MTTAYCYDPLYLEHDLPGHPESRLRLERVMVSLAKTGLVACMTPICPLPVDLSLLEAVHSPAYVAMVRQIVLQVKRVVAVGCRHIMVRG